MATTSEFRSNIVGKTLHLNNRQYQVIGIAPDNFKGTKFGLSMDFWAPMAMVDVFRGSPGWLTERDSHWMNVIGRLKPGVSLAQASAEMNAIASRLNQTYPDQRAKDLPRDCYGDRRTLGRSDGNSQERRSSRNGHRWVCFADSLRQRRQPFVGPCKLPDERRLESVWHWVRVGRVLLDSY